MEDISKKEGDTLAASGTSSNGLNKNGIGGGSNVFKDFNETWLAFDVDKDDGLNLKEFVELCKSLFQNEKGESYELGNGTVEELFRIFDANSNGFLCKKEFRFCFDSWIQRIINPVSVFVIVDVQNDFISGSLALKNSPAKQDGKDVVEPINNLIETVPFKQIFYTRDWHPSNHISFIDNIEMRKLHKSSPIQNSKEAKVLDTVIFEGDQGQPIEQRMWPRHCVQESWGAELDPDLKVRDGSKVVFKGEQPEVDSYSAFLDNDKKSMTTLKGYVDEVGGTDVYVSGLAYDVCVGATTVDSINLGYRTVLVDDAARGVTEEGIQQTKKNVQGLNGVIVSTERVKDMVMGKDRRPELGLHLAQKLHQKMGPEKKP